MKDNAILIERLGDAIAGADAVLVGAGAGLSTAAGLTYSGERFHRLFADFEEAYGIRDMYSGGFYAFPDERTRWAWWSRAILNNRFVDAPKPVYPRLRGLLEGHDSFVLTTNVDHQFQRAGFDRRRLFYTQGDYGLFQCSKPCCQRTWDNEDWVREAVARQEGMRVPADLIPRCPNCGRSLMTNLCADDRFVEDEGWHAAAKRYAVFVDTHTSGRLPLLEVTESAYTEDTEQIVDMVKRLRARGFTIEMDDFGSGYSSLNMIFSLPSTR